MNDKEIIEHLERMKKCPYDVCEVCRGWILQIILALKERTMSKGEFRTISCPTCKKKVFRAIYHYIHNAIGVITLQCTNPKCCKKEIDIVPVDNEDSGTSHETTLEIEYHEQDDLK